MKENEGKKLKIGRLKKKKSLGGLKLKRNERNKLKVKKMEIIGKTGKIKTVGKIKGNKLDGKKKK